MSERGEGPGVTCPRCNGLKRWAYASVHGQPLYEDPCEECKGTGRITSALPDPLTDEEQKRLQEIHGQLERPYPVYLRSDWKDLLALVDRLCKENERLQRERQEAVERRAQAVSSATIAGNRAREAEADRNRLQANALEVFRQIESLAQSAPVPKLMLNTIAETCARARAALAGEPEITEEDIAETRFPRQGRTTP